METLVFTNHAPIRVRETKTAATHFIGPGGYGIGGQTLFAYRNQKGEYLIWLRNVSCYDVPTTLRYVGKFRPGFLAAMQSDGFQNLFSNKTEYGPVEGWQPYSEEERGEIQVWLETLGLSTVEQFI